LGFGITANWQGLKKEILPGSEIIAKTVDGSSLISMSVFINAFP